MKSCITGWLLLFALHLGAQSCPTFVIDSIRTTPPADCGLEDGLISVFATGDNALAYSADGGNSFQNFSVFNGLFPGTYVIVVRDNETGCEEAVGNATISDPDGPDITGIEVEQPTCPDGADNGSISIAAAGTDIEYSIDGGNFYFFDGDFDDLAPGSYEVVLRNGGDCVSYFEGNPVVLNPPDCSGGGQPDSLTVDIVVALATCAGDADGALTAVASGGTLPYSYAWSTGATTATLSPIAAGGYGLTLTDAGGGSIVVDAELPATPPLGLLLASTPIQTGVPGSVSAEPSNGTDPYSYLWSTGATTPVIDVTTPGVYAVTVTDANGCLAEGETEVLEADCNDIAVDIDETNPSCDGEVDGTVTALPSGGTPPYTYLWTTGDTTQTVDSLPAANYRVTLTDALGCTATVATALIDPFPVQFGTSTGAVLCNGQSNGSAHVDLLFGAGTAILWSTGDTTALVEGLSAGSYGVTVTNANGCSDSATLEVFEPAALTLDIQTTAADGTSGGAAVALPAGGTPPYSYDWSNGATDSLLTGLPVGFYTLNVTDANGCAVFGTFAIAAAACTLEVGVDTSLDDCAGSGVGTATAIVSGAAGPFTVVFSTGDTTTVLTDLVAGDYAVQVIDSLGCTASQDFSILQDAAFTVDVESSAETCAGDDGSLTLVIGGATAPVSITLDGTVVDTNVFTELTAGSYTLVITDVTGCSVEVEATVEDDCSPAGCEPLVTTQVGTLVVADCAGTASVCIDLPFFELDEYDLSDNGVAYAGTATGCDFDTTFVYAYGILPGGGADGPFEVRSWTANDSSFSGELAAIASIIDSLAVWDPAGDWRLDTAQQLIVGGVPRTDYGDLELVQTASDTIIILQASFLRTAAGSQLAFGVGAHELVLTETATGCADTLTFEVLCADEPGTAFVVPVFLAPGQSDTICLAELGYAADTITVLPGGCAAGDAAVAEVVPVDDCFVVSGNATGQSTDCYLLCSAQRCDTLILETSVLAPGGPDGPVALPDAQTTGEGLAIVVAVLQNDTLGGGITTFEITLDPQNGEAAILPDQSINYVPDPAFCGVDSFRYTVCTLEGCASAFVTITVLCNKLTIFNGFSPNGDGVNDTFTILGLNSFEGHTLYVYNRWGNLVLQSEDYQNDRQGTWEGNDLPPGVYFYVLQLAGEPEARSGALTLHR